MARHRGNLQPGDLARFAARMGMVRPSHAWVPHPDGVLDAGCFRCPAFSPFALDMASHPHEIEEEP